MIMIIPAIFFGSEIIDPANIPAAVPVNDIKNMIKYIVKNCSAVFARPIIQ